MLSAVRSRVARSAAGASPRVLRRCLHVLLFVARKLCCSCTMPCRRYCAPYTPGAASVAHLHAICACFRCAVRATTASRDAVRCFASDGGCRDRLRQLSRPPVVTPQCSRAPLPQASCLTRS